MTSPYPATEKSDGFTLAVTATVDPTRIDEFLGLFYPCMQKVSNEPECLSFEVFRYPNEPNKLHWVENWSKDVQWFTEHQHTKPYFREYLAATNPLLIGEKKAEVMERFGGPWALARSGVYQNV